MRLGAFRHRSPLKSASQSFPSPLRSEMSSHHVVAMSAGSSAGQRSSQCDLDESAAADGEQSLKLAPCQLVNSECEPYARLMRSLVRQYSQPVSKL